MEAILIDLIIRGLALGLNSNVIKEKIKAIRDAKGADLTPKEFADGMAKLVDEKAAEARAAVNQ